MCGLRMRREPRQELVRLDGFEILSSPLSRPIDYARTAALQMVAEVLEEGAAGGAPEDAVFRLALAVLDEMQVGRVWMPVTYFALWMNRLMGGCRSWDIVWFCGLDLRGGARWIFGPTSDGVTCGDDRRGGSLVVSRSRWGWRRGCFVGPWKGLAEEAWPSARGADLRRFAVETLERHLERRLVSARALGRA